MGVQRFVCENLWEVKDRFQLLDVRTPAEFEKGHIPGAKNLPLFSNEERAIVGTCFKKDGPEEAFLKGLELVGPNMTFFVKKANELAPRKKIAIHCWRGGKRSGSMAWLLDQAGFDVAVLEGGYKAYRTYILQQFGSLPLQLIMLGGKTGSGKSVILEFLEKKGQQIIDLEGLANHKGSAFGTIGEYTQPTVEQFENTLFELLLQLDCSKPVWVENESRGIGKIYLPEGFWKQMKNAPLVNIEVPLNNRLDHLVQIYGTTNLEELKEAFQKIKKRLGGKHLKEAINYIDHNNLKEAAAIALRYYDKTYTYNLSKNQAPKIYQLDFEHMNFDIIANSLITFLTNKIVQPNNEAI